MISTEEAVFSHQHSDMPRPNSLRLQTSPEEMDDVFGGVLNCDMTEDNGNFESNSISDIESTDSRDWSLDNAKDDSNSNSMSEYLRDLVLDRDEEDATVADLVVGTTEDSDQLMESSHQNRMRIALGIILRLVLPLANGLARGLKGIRDVRFLRALRNLISSRQALTNAMAYAANTISMGLSSVQVSHRIDPLLKMMKLKRCEGVIESIPDGTTPLRTPLTPEPRIGFSIPSLMFENHEDAKAEECCSIKILAEPPPGTPIRADIVLIHGLHGSLVNTWKQGLWCNNRGPEHFERPPKPEVRPPKRPRHSRSNIILPPHKEKRRRFADREHFSSIHHDSDDGGMAVDSNVFTYECGAPEEVRFCDGLEYSFPSFRLRLDKNSNFFDPDYESARTTNIKKPSVNDPNYSKCWPGDWLPIDCPGVRVIALNYTTDKYLWRPAWKQKEARSSLIERAREMTDLLVERKVGYGHPIVWVGHSKGGIFIKQIIVDAWESGRLATAPLWRSSRGTFFYSVPHRGSHLASIKAPFLRRSVELVDIEKNSKYLLDLHRRFVGLYQMGHLKIEVFSFVETALTLMSVLYLRIVGVDSADPGIGEVCGLHLDHREICKPRSRDCILYKELVKMIKKVC